jgi:hypothetical protein
MSGALAVERPAGGVGAEIDAGIGKGSAVLEPRSTRGAFDLDAFFSGDAFFLGDRVCFFAVSGCAASRDAVLLTAFFLDAFLLAGGGVRLADAPGAGATALAAPADTSRVQRTSPSAFADGILMTCFGTDNLRSLTLSRNSHARRIHPEISKDHRRCLQNGGDETNPAITRHDVACQACGVSGLQDSAMLGTN